MKNILKVLSSLMIALVFVFAGCEDRTDLTAPPAPSLGSIDATTFVTLGNSLTAGYQSGALYKSAQEYSFGNLIAQQLGTKFEQPYISDPGLGNRMEVTSLSPFALTYNTNQGSPLNLNYAAPYNNLGVPGALLVHMLNTKSTATDTYTNNPLFDVILRDIGTEVEQAISLNPTIMTLWIGNNDILGYATSGGTRPYTDTPTFQFLYNSMLDALKAGTSAKVLCANIPSVTAIPYFRTVGPSVGLAIKPAVDGGMAVGLFYNTNGQFGPADLTSLATPTALFNGDVLLTLAGSAYASLIGTPTGKFYRDNGIDPSLIGVDTTKAFGLDPANPFPDAFVLDPAEIATVATQISDFNAAISSLATAHGYVVVDMNSFFNDVAANGITVNGVSFTTTYVTGGLFSLDGVHPTSQGYAIVANEFIKAMNSNFAASVPSVDVSTIPGSLILAKKVQFNKYGLPIIEPGAFDNLKL